MEENGLLILRKLISDIEGAPYPNEINSERYTIWYLHVQEIAQEALKYLVDYVGYEPEPDAEIP
jgi:hypothetical protein